MRELLHRPREGITYVPWEPVQLCRVVGEWPQDAWFPQALTRRPSAQHLRDVARYCLGTLVTQAVPRHDVRSALEGIGLRQETGPGTLAKQRSIQSLQNDIPSTLRAAVVRRRVGARAEDDQDREEAL